VTFKTGIMLLLGGKDGKLG